MGTLNVLLTFSNCSDGQGNEGDGRHEEEGHLSKDRRSPSLRREDQQYQGWLDRFWSDKEQERKDREQEEICAEQEELLDDCRSEGKEGIEGQGLRRNQEGLRALQEGKGVPVKMPVTASAWGVGISTPFERYSLNCIEVEHR